MDLGEKADLCDYEKIHRMIESTYKNILKNYNPGVKQLIVLGKALQKTIQNVGTSFKAYNECLYELARSAESCKGSTKELGLGLLQLTDSQSTINQHLTESIKVFHAELLIPLKAKQETEFRHLQVLYDKYLAGHKYHSNNLRKAQHALEKYKKKTRSKSGQKELEKTRHMRECKRKLEEYLRKNLRLTLLEERKRYCYLFNRLLCVTEDKVNKYTKANEMLMEGLRNWPELCRSPHILPTATEQVIHDFGFSDDSGDIEDEPSCDGDPGEARFNQRPPAQKHDSLPGYDWSSRNAPASAAVAAIEEMQRKHSATLTPTRHLFESQDVQELKAQPIPSVLCAIYPYVAATETQLSLEANDVIRIHGDVQNGWLFGRNIRTDKDGWFPISFTDFNDELLQWKTAHLRNSSLTNLRNTWLTEVGYDYDRRPSRCSESDASEAVSAAAETARQSGRVSAPPVVTRPISYSVSSDATDHQLTRTKFLHRRTLALEPISENIPPPEEFRDRNEQMNAAGDKVSMATRNLELHSTPVSSAEGQTTVEWRARTQTKSGVTATEVVAGNQPSTGITTENQSSVTARRPATELTGEDEFPPSEFAPIEAGRFTLQLESEPVAFPPPPPSPLPPLPPLPVSAGAHFSKPPRHMNPSRPTDNPIANAGSTDIACAGIIEGSSGGANEGNSGFASAGASDYDASVTQTRSVVLSKTPVVQSSGTADEGDSSAISQPTPNPPPQRPPPPPPPLPLGSYHSVRGDHFARPRLRKTLSMDNTKIN